MLREAYDSSHACVRVCARASARVCCSQVATQAQPRLRSRVSGAGFHARLESSYEDITPIPPSTVRHRPAHTNTHSHTTQDESACMHNHLTLPSGELFRPAFWSSYIIRLHCVCKHVKSLSLPSRRFWRLSKSTLTNFHPERHLLLHLPPPSPPSVQLNNT